MKQEFTLDEVWDHCHDQTGALMIDAIDKKTLGIVRFTENSGRIVHYQVTIDPSKKSPSGQFMRFGTHAMDEITGWQPLAGLVLVEVLSQDWQDELPEIHDAT